MDFFPSGHFPRALSQSPRRFRNICSCGYSSERHWPNTVRPVSFLRGLRLTLIPLESPLSTPSILIEKCNHVLSKLLLEKIGSIRFVEVRNELPKFYIRELPLFIRIVFILSLSKALFLLG